MSRYRDAQAMVTGAASGIGFALAAELLRLGARVALADIDHAALAAAVARLDADPARIYAAPLDVTSEAAVRAFVAEVLGRCATAR